MKKEFDDTHTHTHTHTDRQTNTSRLCSAGLKPPSHQTKTAQIARVSCVRKVTPVHLQQDSCFRLHLQRVAVLLYDILKSQVWTPRVSPRRKHKFHWGGISFTHWSKNIFFAPQRGNVAPINVRFGTGCRNVGENQETSVLSRLKQR